MKAKNNNIEYNNDNDKKVCASIIER